MGWIEVGSTDYNWFYITKSATTSLFETLWYHKVVSGFFEPNRLHDVINGFFDIAAGMQFDFTKRLKLGTAHALPVGMFCYVKHKTGYLQTPSGRQYKHPITKKLRRNVLEYYGYQCCYCGVKLTGESSDTNIHHLIPETFGGKTDLRNLRPICLSCHKSLGFEFWKRAKSRMHAWKTHRALQLSPSSV
jgi:hypothetical protein